MKAAHWADSFRRSEPSAEMIAIERAKAFLTDVSESSEMRNRNAYGALTAIASEVPEPSVDVAQVLAWIDRTLALPMYQGGELTDYADATVTALRSVRKMLDGTSRPDASWRDADLQGEPSDDGHLITDCEHGVNSLYDRCVSCEAAEQGERSDALDGVPEPARMHVAAEGGGVLCGAVSPTHITNGTRYADCAACLAAAGGHDEKRAGAAPEGRRYPG